MGGRRAHAAGPRRPAAVGAAGDRAPRTRRSGTGSRTPLARHRRQFLKPSLHPRAQEGGGGAEQGGCPRGPAARPSWGRSGSAGGRGQVEGPGRPWPRRRAPGLRTANGHPPAPLPPAAALASLPTPPPALQGTRDRFLPGPAAHQSRPSTDPFYDWGQGGERTGKSRGTQGVGWWGDAGPGVGEGRPAGRRGILPQSPPGAPSRGAASVPPPSSSAGVGEETAGAGRGEEPPPFLDAEERGRPSLCLTPALSVGS